MPRELTTEELIALTRGHLQNYNQTPWRDGFADDFADTEDETERALLMATNKPITDALNEAQRQALETGYAKCDFNMKLVAGRREYALDPWVHETITVTYKGVPLRHTTIGELDKEIPDWRNHPNGTPQRYYFVGDVIGLYPTPSASDPEDGAGSIDFKADSTVPDLVLRTQKPRRLPVRFHALLAIGAAYILSAMDADNDSSTRRAGFLKSWWYAGLEQLRALNKRDTEEADQIEPLDYRGHYR